MTFLPVLNLSALDGSNGFVLSGIDADDFSGSSVSGAGDINGDGIADLIIGAIGASPNGTESAGESYVVFGSNTGFNAQLNLATLDGSNGFVITGIDAGDVSGGSVSGAGDVNGDGIADLIIGAAGGASNGNLRAGESYVVFGSNTGFNARFALATLDGDNGFILTGIDENDLAGVSVSGAGDINGDGIDDLIIGASGASPNGNRSAGESYVVFGSDIGFDARLDLVTLNGRNGFAIAGINAFDFSGRSLSAAGDINGDGIDDLIIGASDAEFSNNQEAGESYVIFGRRDLASSSNFFSFELSRQIIRPVVGDIPYTPVEVGGINLGQFLDEGYYLSQNPDIAAAIDNGQFSSGFDHFIQFGLAEGRNSNSLFNEQAYLVANSDVANAVDDGLIDSGLRHFLLFGHLEGRKPSQLFNEAEYLALYTDVAAAVQAGGFGSGFEHYVEAGAQEGRLPERSLFQEDFYLAQNSDVADAVQAGIFASGFDHFARFGASEGRDPSSLFSNEAYLNAHSDVAAAVSQGSLASGFLHYAVFGAAEGRALV